MSVRIASNGTLSPPFGRGWIGAYALGWAAVIALFIAQGLAALRAYEWGGVPFEIARVTATGWLIRALVALPFFAWIRMHPIGAAWRRDVPKHAAAMVAFVIVENVVCWSAERLLPYLKQHTLAEVFASETHLDVLTYGVLLGAVQTRTYWRELRRREEEARELALAAARLQTQLAEARLAALRTQLQPHFLFNALHAISALIHTDPEKADRMVERLSDLLRLVVEHDGRPLVPLREELEIVDRYLAIQQMRYGERLQVEREMERDALDARVPALLLQPLVENAVRHGIERKASGGRITLRALRDGALLHLAIEDDGPGPAAARPGNGVGLKNARARLEQLYGAKASLRLEPRQGGGTRAIVTLPWEDAP